MKYVYALLTVLAVIVLAEPVMERADAHSPHQERCKAGLGK